MFGFGLLPATVFFGSAIVALAANGVQGVSSSQTTLDDLKADIRQVADSAPIRTIPGFSAVGASSNATTHENVPKAGNAAAGNGASPTPDIASDVNDYFKKDGQAFSEATYRAAVKARADSNFDRSDKRAVDEANRQYLSSGAIVHKDKAPAQKTATESGMQTDKGVGVTVTIYGFDKPLSPSELKHFSGAETGLSLRNEFMGKIVTTGVGIVTDGFDASGAPRGMELDVYEEMNAIDGLVSKPDGSEPRRLTSPYRSGLTFTTKGLHLGANEATLKGGNITISALNSLETFDIGGDAALQSIGMELKVIQGDWTIPYGRRIAFEIAAPRSAGDAKRKFEVITLEVSYPFDVTE